MHALSAAERRVMWAIRGNAVVLLMAVVPACFPTEVMAALNDRLGLDPLPRTPLVEYLTRSAAACYALHGGMLWLLATDVRRYRPLIPWVYALHLAFAVAIAGIDAFAGLPTWWLAVESGTIATVAVLVLTLHFRTVGSPPLADAH